MPIRTSTPSTTQPLDRRLLKYSLAVGALCTATSAHAEIIYSGEVNLPVAPSLSVNFSPLAATVFTLSLIPTAIIVDPSIGTALNTGPLSFGTSITLANTTNTTSLQKLVEGLPSSPGGPWVDFSGIGYMGVKFTVSSQEYLGWAALQLDQSPPSATLVSYAYNDQPGQAIAAGDTGVPEPSSLTLFALGAAGVLAVRRRRQANNSSDPQS